MYKYTYICISGYPEINFSHSDTLAPSPPVLSHRCCAKCSRCLTRGLRPYGPSGKRSSQTCATAATTPRSALRSCKTLQKSAVRYTICGVNCMI